MADVTAAVIAALRSYRFNFTNERELQDGIESVFRVVELPFVREYRLGPGDIVDFLCAGDTGVEVKIGGSPSGILRQLMRYAEHDAIRAVVLVTRKLQHTHAFPPSLAGKPLRVATLGGGWL
jgi:AMMECR1 domain-containing protein